MVPMACLLACSDPAHAVLQTALAVSCCSSPITCRKQTVCNYLYCYANEPRGMRSSWVWEADRVSKDPASILVEQQRNRFAPLDLAWPFPSLLAARPSWEEAEESGHLHISSQSFAAPSAPLWIHGSSRHLSPPLEP